MSEPVLDLGNSQNWESVWNYQTVAVRFPGDTSRYYPIPEITCPIIFDKFVLAVLVTSPSAPRYWRFAGWINQQLRIGVTVGGNLDATVVEKRKLWLNQITLIRLSKLAENYGVSFMIPYWFEDASVSVWKYIGLDTNTTTQMLETLKIDVLRVERKVDDIAAFGR